MGPRFAFSHKCTGDAASADPQTILQGAKQPRCLGLVQFKMFGIESLNLLGIKNSFENQMEVLDTPPQDAYIQIF